METDATLTLRIGSPVACTDGAYGELADLVIAAVKPAEQPTNGSR